MENTFCQNCGNSLNDDDIFCSKCGKEIHHEKPVCPQCGEKIIGNPMFCSKCGIKLQEEKKQEEVRPDEELPMNWYKFVIYFEIWSGFVMYLIMGFVLLTGYDNEFMYYRYPDLQNVNVSFSLIFFAIAVWVLMIRQKLVKFKKNSSDSYIICSIISNVVLLIYNLIICDIINTNVAEYVVNFAAMAVVTACEYFYFKKRKHLFIND